MLDPQPRRVRFDHPIGNRLRQSLSVWSPSGKETDSTDSTRGINAFEVVDVKSKKVLYTKLGSPDLSDRQNDQDRTRPARRD